MNTAVEKFRDKIKKGKCVAGPFMKSLDPAFVEIAGHAGFDFVILDMEHGPSDVPGLQNLIRAAQCTNVLPVVRVPDTTESLMSKVLDAGASGIQVSQIVNAKQAEDAVKNSKFSPAGHRGVCRFVRAAGYSSIDRFEYFKQANESLIILQLEGEEAINNLREILNVRGIDIIFIGPYDLSQSLGVPGQIDHPAVFEKMRYIVDEAKKRNIVTGTFVDNYENATLWKSMGVQYISYSVDVGIFYNSCREIVKQLGD
jgi:4-hydroxy-2-oxoheptanedioate aldolase